MKDAARLTRRLRGAFLRFTASTALVGVLGLGGAWAVSPPGGAASSPAPAPLRPATNDGIEWKSLSASQRQALAPLERDWASFESAQKQKWVELAQRFPRMPVEERSRIQGRMAEWARMTPAERGEARLRYLQARRASPDGRGALWEDYQALPTDRKKELAARATVPVQTKPPVAKPGNGEKSNLVTSPAFPLPPKPVAPTVIQARPGATTTLVSKQPAPPPHQQVGLPKIAATPGFIDKNTLLPRRGAQGAATLSVNNDDIDLEPVPRP